MRQDVRTGRPSRNHPTPPDVADLMMRLLFQGDDRVLQGRARPVSIFDPTCGVGNLLVAAMRHLRVSSQCEADVTLHGQEIDAQVAEECRAALLAEGLSDEAIRSGSCISQDAFAGVTFDYLIGNPPYGDQWRDEAEFVRREAERGSAGRFGAGVPPESDGQLLFLQHLLAKTKPVEEGGSRLVMLTNGAPLYNGEPGGGESEVRRWVLENDWLEVVVSLPGGLLEGTDMPLFLWVLTNRKPEERRRKVLLVNGSAPAGQGEDGTYAFARTLRRSGVGKRSELAEDHIAELTRLTASFSDGPYTRAVPILAFGHRLITIEQPLRLSFQITPERIEQFRQSGVFERITTASKPRRDGTPRNTRGRRRQEGVLAALGTFDPSVRYTSRSGFEQALGSAFRDLGVSVPGYLRRAIVMQLAEEDPAAEVCLDDAGQPEVNARLREFVTVPLAEDPRVFFEREVKPWLPGAWIADVTDARDGGLGVVGYAVDFARFFHKRDQHRPLGEIDQEIRSLETEILGMLWSMQS